ncbi:MAG: DUF1211 domain-containing protein [Phycisphaeraceae bacterium]|nr:DUF1211 domain-containing protein [Phycisphaeraceae bacterium]
MGMNGGAMKVGERCRDGFRARGEGPSRLDALTDGVFALAITLLVVTNEIPTRFDEFMSALLGFPAFAACFAILIWFWFTHHVYSRRMGLIDAPTTAITAVLLFIVLFFVYVMKYLYAWLLAHVIGVGPRELVGPLSMGDARLLMALFSVGFLAVCLVFVALYGRAWRIRERLGLDEIERLVVKDEVVNWVALGGIPVVSLGLLATNVPWLIAAGGWCYGFIGVVKFVTGHWHGRRLERAIGKSSN